MYVMYLWGRNMGPIAWSHCDASPSYHSGWGNKFSVSVSVAEIFESPPGLFVQCQFDDGDVPQCIYYTTGSLTNYSMQIHGILHIYTIQCIAYISKYHIPIYIYIYIYSIHHIFIVPFIKSAISKSPRLQPRQATPSRSGSMASLDLADVPGGSPAMHGGSEPKQELGEAEGMPVLKKAKGLPNPDAKQERTARKSAQPTKVEIAPAPPPSPSPTVHYSPKAPPCPPPPRHTTAKQLQQPPPKPSVARPPVPPLSLLKAEPVSTAPMPTANQVPMPKASQVTMPKASQVAMPKASQMTMPEASQVTMPEASQLTMPETSQVTKKEPVEPTTILKPVATPSRATRVTRAVSWDDGHASSQATTVHGVPSAEIVATQTSSQAPSATPSAAPSATPSAEVPATQLDAESQQHIAKIEQPTQEAAEPKAAQSATPTHPPPLAAAAPAPSTQASTAPDAAVAPAKASCRPAWTPPVQVPAPNASVQRAAAPQASAPKAATPTPLDQQFHVADQSNSLQPASTKERQSHYAAFKRQVTGEISSITVPQEFVEAWEQAVASNSRSAKNKLFQLWCTAGGSWSKSFVFS